MHRVAVTACGPVPVPPVSSTHPVWGARDSVHSPAASAAHLFSVAKHHPVPAEDLANI